MPWLLSNVNKKEVQGFKGFNSSRVEWWDGMKGIERTARSAGSSQFSRLCTLSSSHNVLSSHLLSYNDVTYSAAETFKGGRTKMRRLMLFVRTFRNARALGFTFVDAMRAARVNSYTA